MITPVQPWAGVEAGFYLKPAGLFLFQEPHRCRAGTLRQEDSPRGSWADPVSSSWGDSGPFSKESCADRVCTVFKAKQRKQQPIKMKYFQFPPMLSVICPRGSTIFPSLLTGDNE